MSYLDAFGANLLLKDSQGRLVYIASRRRHRAFIVPPDRADELLRFVRTWFGIAMLSVLGTMFLFGPKATIAVGIVLVLAFRVRLGLFTRGLEVAPELPVVTREEAITRNMKAMGPRTIAVVCALGAIQAAIGVWTLLDGERAWWAWFLTLYGGTVAVLYFRRWTQLHRLR